MDDQTRRQVLEAAIFAADTPLNRQAMMDLFDPGQLDKADLENDLLALGDEYAERGLELREVASGFRFQVRRELGPWVSRLWEEKPQRYSRAILETLALIAYRQPVTRGEIEEVRGVSVSSHIVKTLLERNWVRVVGHRDVPGRPALYATTRQFLDYFDLASLDQLPTLTEIRDLDEINRELGLEPEQKTNVTTEADTAGEMAGQEAALPAITAGEEAPPAVAEVEWQKDEFSQVDSVLANFEEEFGQKKGARRKTDTPNQGTVDTAENSSEKDVADSRQESE